MDSFEFYSIYLSQCKYIYWKGLTQKGVSFTPKGQKILFSNCLWLGFQCATKIIEIIEMRGDVQDICISKNMVPQNIHSSMAFDKLH